MVFEKLIYRTIITRSVTQDIMWSHRDVVPHLKTHPISLFSVSRGTKIGRIRMPFDDPTKLGSTECFAWKIFGVASAEKDRTAREWCLWYWREFRDESSPQFYPSLVHWLLRNFQFMRVHMWCVHEKNFLFCTPRALMGNGIKKHICILFIQWELTSFLW